METLKKVWNWLQKSSANPQKLSLTLKAGIPFLITALPFVISGLDTGSLQDNLLQAADALVAVIAGAVTLIGLARKIYLSVTAPKK